MVDQLHHHAEATTPDHVDVPETTRGLIIWAIGRFGTAIILAAAAGWAAVTIYHDSKDERAAYDELRRNDQKLRAEQTSTLKEISKTLDTIDSRLRYFPSP